MKDNIKTILAYISIFVLIGLIGVVTYYKYFVTEENKDYGTAKDVQKINGKHDMRDIKNLEDIETSNFLISDLGLKFDDENQVITITGNINNITEVDQNYKIMSSIYNKDKALIHSKQISVDAILKANDTIPFFINHYYDELNTNNENIKYYKLEIKE